MGRLNFALIAFGLAMPTISAAATTAELAREMPVADLARKLLGESGAVMMEVDRPRFEGILEPVRFYSHATVTGSQFGICGADWVTVGFDDEGKVERLSSERRFGVAGDVYRAPGAWDYEESGRVCRSVKSTRTYFPAPDQIAAQKIAWYVDAVWGRGPFAKQSFAYTCVGLCAKGRGDLRCLKLDLIDSARAVDCPVTALAFPACFEVTVGEHEVGPFPKQYRIYGTTHMNKVVVQSVAVEVGSTLE